MQVYKIQAAVLRKKGGPLMIESIEMEGPRDDEILVRIVASGICRTDIDLCDDWDEADTPVVLGQEREECEARRSCRSLLSVLRPLPPMPERIPRSLQVPLRGELWFPAPGRQQCAATQRRPWALLRSVFVRQPCPGDRTQPRQGF